MNAWRAWHGAMWGGAAGSLLLVVALSDNAPASLAFPVAGVLLALMLVFSSVLPSPAPRPSMFLMIPNLPAGADILAYTAFVALFMLAGYSVCRAHVRFRPESGPPGKISFASGVVLFVVLAIMATDAMGIGVDRRPAPAFRASGQFRVSIANSLYLEPGRNSLFTQSAFVTFVEDLVPGSDAIEVVFPTKTITAAMVPRLVKRGSGMLKSTPHAILTVFLSKDYRVDHIDLTFTDRNRTVSRTIAVTPEAAKRQFHAISITGNNVVLESTGAFDETGTTEAITLNWFVKVDLPISRKVFRE